MSEFTEMLERIRLDNLIAHIMYGPESDIEKGDNYANIIESSYDIIFEKLEKLYSGADRKDDELYSAVMDFSIIHSEVYLGIGLLIGFNLHKNLEEGFKNLEIQDIQSTIAKWTITGKKDKK
jgi:hypothetical protein